ncbi:glycoside hydrolase family 9 protein [Microbacterium sp. NPDC089696]|uniref:glycoside hydrolase family 9 protein n=1 Tax=Microbacterium sp. NPDC089696 TaxID=3364199 RepID=UPI00382B874D
MAMRPRLRHSRAIPALTTAALLAALAGCSATTAPQDTPSALVRVDQNGYVLGAENVAFAMGDAGSLGDAGFRVVDQDGATVAEGDLGDDRGAWNDRFDGVRPIDLGEIDEPGTYRIELTGGVRGESPEFAADAVENVLGPPASMTLEFFRAQRDGADVDPAVMDRNPSHLLDTEASVYETPTFEDGGALLVGDLVPSGDPPRDVSGGWFDAGDFLKFTGTTAYAAITMMVADREGAVSSEDLSAEIGFGLDWLDRMWDPATETLALQVGIGSGNESVRSDHDVWRLPEEDDVSAPESSDDPDWFISHRPVFLAGGPGEPIAPSVAGRVSAAFALAAQRAAVDGDAETARAWLTKAARVYDLADRDPAQNATALPAEFYPEDSWQDDLELAAVELALAGRALGDDRAEAWATDAGDWAAAYIASDVKGTLGVGDVSAVAHSDLLAAGAPDPDSLIADLRRPLDDAAVLAADDPFGAGVSQTEFDAVPFAFGLVATAAYYERATGDDDYRAFADRQRGWLFGANPWGTSFMIGVGSTYPQCPEHQVANLADAGALRGAVVNGPNAAEQLEELNGFDDMVPCAAAPPGGAEWTDFDGQGSRYLDEVGAWQTVEPAIDFTASALLAFSASLSLAN